MAKKMVTKKSTASPASNKAGAASRAAGDWRGDTLSRIRTLIQRADPGMIEEQKWKKPSNGMAGVPAWSHDGLVCMGETYKDYVKVTFAHGAELPDPKRLFNASLEGNARRAIDIREGQTFDESAFKALIKAAVARNRRGQTQV